MPLRLRVASLLARSLARKRAAFQHTNQSRRSLDISIRKPCGSMRPPLACKCMRGSPARTRPLARRTLGRRGSGAHWQTRLRARACTCPTRSAKPIRSLDARARSLGQQRRRPRSSLACCTLSAVHAHLNAHEHTPVRSCALQSAI